MNFPGVDTYVFDTSATKDADARGSQICPCQMDAECRLLALRRHRVDISARLVVVSIG
jgi:hypothetical protein